jgi:hypothetical protein
MDNIAITTMKHHFLLLFVSHVEIRARRPLLAMAVFLSVIGIDFVGSRHLVFN